VLVVHALSASAMSLPWPLLLVLVAEDTDGGALLGAAAAARLAPYVGLSWWVGRLADRYARDRIVRATLVARTAILAVVAVAMAADRTGAAVVAASLAVAAGTPAYPALAAGMPRLAGPDSQRATELLVTIEVASFVVGPAVGGLLLLAPASVAPAALALAAASVVGYAGIRQPAPVRVAPAVAVAPNAPPGRRPLAFRPLRGALLAVMLVNGIGSAAAVTLLPLAEQRWAGSGTDSAYGVATALLGFGALGGPLLASRGRRSRQPLGPGLLLVGVALVAVAGSPTAWWAAVPLLLTGAAAVQVEAAATETIQREAGDDRSAGVLGLADTLMVSAGLVGAVAAPVLTDLVGAVPLLALLGSLSTLPVAVAAVRHRAAGYPTTAPRRTTVEGRASTVRSASGSLS
jgi:MFS family permease